MKNKYFLLGLLLCLISCEPATEEKNISVDLGPEIVDKWQILKSQDGSEPIARHEAAFVQVGNKFVLFGGRRVQKTSIFDVNTQSWSEGAEPLIEMHHFQPVVFDDKIYVLGALTGGYPDETPIPNVHIYDPATDEWTIGDEIPEERRRGSTGNVVYNGSIYMSCGIKNGHIGDHKNGWIAMIL